MDSNKKMGIIGVAILAVFLSGFFGWGYYSDKKSEREAAIQREIDLKEQAKEREKLEAIRKEQKEKQEKMDKLLAETKIEKDTEDIENAQKIDEDQVYRYMKYQFDTLTDNGENYNADYHDPLVANMAAQKFRITPSEANDIYGRKDYENVFGN